MPQGHAINRSGDVLWQLSHEQEMLSSSDKREDTGKLLQLLLHICKIIVHLQRWKGQSSQLNHIYNSLSLEIIRIFDLLKCIRQLLTPITARSMTDIREYKPVSCILLISMTIWHFACPTNTTPHFALAQTHGNVQEENNYEIIS